MQTTTGLSVFGLKPGTIVHIRTCNNDYELLVLSRPDLLVRGGKHYPEWRRVSFRGDEAPEPLVHEHDYITQGTRLQFYDGSQYVKTSCVHRFDVDEM